MVKTKTIFNGTKTVDWNNPKDVLQYQKEYRCENIESVRESSKNWKKCNSDSVKMYYTQYRLEHSDICKKSYNTWRKNNLEKDRLRNRLSGKKWRKHYRKIIIWHYSRGMMCCNYCGDTRQWALQIDHIMGDGKRHRKKYGSAITAFLIRNNLPIGYQILCACCNKAKYTMTDEEYVSKYPDRVTNEHRLIHAY